MKDLILKLPFIQAYVRDIKIQAFVDAQKDVLETMQEDIAEKVSDGLQEALVHLLSSVDYAKVVTMDKQRGLVFIGGKKATPDKLSNIKAEAEFILNSEIWKLLYESPKALAEKAMFINGESIEDMRKGRATLYCLSQQKNILDLFKSYEAKK